MKALFISIFFITIFQSCITQKTFKYVKIANANLFKPSKRDTLNIKTLSVIDRFWDNSVNVFQRSRLPFLVKGPETIGKPEELYDELDYGRYEYSYYYVLKSLKNLIDTGIYPIKLDKNFTYKNDSLFKPLLKDSAFKINFDTNHIKKLSLKVENGLHIIVTVTRYHDSFDRVAGEQTMLLFIYFEFVLIKQKEIQNYSCVIRKRPGNGGINAFKPNSKRHRWRVDNEDLSFIFSKLFDLAENKTIK